MLFGSRINVGSVIRLRSAPGRSCEIIDRRTVSVSMPFLASLRRLTILFTVVNDRLFLRLSLFGIRPATAGLVACGRHTSSASLRKRSTATLYRTCAGHPRSHRGRQQAGRVARPTPQRRSPSPAVVFHMTDGVVATGQSAEHGCWRSAGVDRW